MFTSPEKNMFVGATATAMVAAGVEGYYSYMDGQGKAPANTFPYIVLHPALPPVEDFLTNLGTPAVLFLLGKFAKKESLRTMAHGGLIYGISELIGQTIYRVAKQTQTPAARYTLVRR